MGLSSSTRDSTPRYSSCGSSSSPAPSWCFFWASRCLVASRRRARSQPPRPSPWRLELPGTTSITSGSPGRPFALQEATGPLRARGRARRARVPTRSNFEGSIEVAALLLNPEEQDEVEVNKTHKIAFRRRDVLHFLMDFSSSCKGRHCHLDTQALSLPSSKPSATESTATAFSFKFPSGLLRP